MATIKYQPISEGTDAGVTLCSAQGTTGDSTNVMDRGTSIGSGIVEVTTSSSSSVTFTIQGSPDGINWFTIPYSTIALPGTLAVAAITLSAAGTTAYWLAYQYLWRFLKLNFSSNATTVTAVAFSR